VIRPPVIIIGMHRSGTTLVVALLKKLGFFPGARMGPNLEAFFFQRLNEWFLRRAGGAWDYPLPIKLLYQVESLRHEAENIVRHAVSSRQFSEFTGFLTNILHNEKDILRKPWGWKDPRTVFTLRLWVKPFPDARLLYIKRNGIDAANSLFVRATRKPNIIPGSPLSVMRLRWRIRTSLRPIEKYVMESVRCNSLNECFKLWEEYITEAEHVFSEFDGQKMAIRYEDLLENPSAYMKQIAAFCGLNFSNRGIDNITSTVNRHRAYAFMQDESLCEFYEKVKDYDLMQKLGYNNIL
jgi:hypothetical protein